MIYIQAEALKNSVAQNTYHPSPLYLEMEMIPLYETIPLPTKISNL